MLILPIGLARCEEAMRHKYQGIMLLAVCCLLVSNTFSVIRVHAIATKPEWTIAIYLDSDNDLGYYAEKDVAEMMMVGSTKDVNVLIFWDKFDGPAYAYRVLQGGLQKLTVFNLNGIEPNMGDPRTLKDWVTYTSTNFPSAKFALLCWDHGDDFRGCMYDEHVPEEGFDLLTHQEMVVALKGLHIDVLIFGACVLQEIEVAYEYSAGGLDIGYIVANEGYDPMDGFPYDTILTSLTAMPTQSPLDFSKMLVDKYIYYYEYTGKAYSQAVTLSVVQLSKVDQVVADLKAMTEAIMVDMKGYAEIVSAASGRANLPWSQNGWERLIDLPTFVRTIHDKSLDPREVKYIDPALVENVVLASENLLTSLNDAILYHRNTRTMDKKGCSGIGIYFPKSLDSYEQQKHLYGDLYPLMAFANEGWLDFLYAYWNA